MVPIANRPMMEHILRLLAKHDFDQVWATLFYLGASIENYFESGQNFGQKLHYCYEEQPLGTAGSVKQAVPFMDETFLVISGDALTDIDLTRAVQFHKQREALATLVLTKVDNPLEYGVVITEPEGKIKRFLEKPGWGQVFSDTVNTGIYVLEPEALDYFEAGQVFDFSKDLFPKLLKKGAPLYGYVADGYWSDIGNLDQYRQAHYDLLGGKIKLNPSGQEIKPGIWVGVGTEIDPNVVIEAPVMIGNYCRIKSGAQIGAFSIIGDHTCVAEGSSIKRSVLGANCYVGPQSELRGAIVDAQVHLRGNNAVFEGAVLGQGVSLGRKAVVKTQVKVWPEKVIDSGTRLNESLIWARKSSRSLFGNEGINGTVNWEITPERVAKYGAVFGARLKPGARVVVGGDRSKAAQGFKKAVVAGLLAVGVDVYDLGIMPAAIPRYAVVSLKAQGGIYLRAAKNSSEELLLEFFDEQGLKIGKEMERALENSYCCEDFPRVSVDGLGELIKVPAVFDSYLQCLLNEQLVQNISRRNYKIALRYEPGYHELLLPGLFEHLGCELLSNVVLAATVVAPSKIELLEVVRQNQADLGIYVDGNGQSLLLLDESGAMLEETEIATFLESRGLKQAGKTASQSDVLFSLVQLLELMVKEKLGLAQIKGLLEGVSRYYQEAECPWEAKGRIMRCLFEENEERRAEISEGLKIIHDDGWAMVLPDGEEPVFRIYTEAQTPEAANGLAHIYLDRIKELQLEQ